MKTVPQGAATTVYAATAPDLAPAHRGAFLADCRVATPSAAARDGEMARKLWVKTQELLDAALAAAAKAS